MELYNFFTEMIPETDKRFHLFERCMDELKSEFPEGFYKLIEYKGHIRYRCIIGQVLGEDTNLGDTELNVIFSDMKYSWIDAFSHLINDIPEL